MSRGRAAATQSGIHGSVRWLLELVLCPSRVFGIAELVLWNSDQENRCGVFVRDARHFMPAMSLFVPIFRHSTSGPALQRIADDRLRAVRGIAADRRGEDSKKPLQANLGV